MPASVHSHYYQGDTNNVQDHYHSFSGKTSKEPDYIRHIHYISGYTSMDQNHSHYFSFITGPEIKMPEGHIHYYMGYTSIHDTHFHLIQGYTKTLNRSQSNPTHYESESKKHFSLDEAKKVGDGLGIDWSKFDIKQFRTGMDVELEHGKINPHTNVSNDDPITTGKIALAHLNEFPDYYIRLTHMEEEAEEYWEHHHDKK